MFPTICQIGSITIYSYGVMMAIAVIICSYFLSRDVAGLKISADKVYDFIFWVVILGILGARLYFILLNLEYFIANPLEIIMIQRGGLCWQGGLIAGTLTAVFLIKKNKWPLWQFLDYAAPYVALGQSIGRIGCLFNGCCYGKAVVWGMYFPVHQARLHPTQLYDAIGLFLIFFLLKRIQLSNQIPGRIFVLYLFLAALQRFVIEFFRADHEILFLGLSIFQIVCLGLIGVAGYVNVQLKSRFRQ